MRISLFNILLFSTGLLFLGAGVNAWTNHNLESANFIAEKGIINDKSANPVEYNLDFNITRREMLKVMMNLSGKDVPDRCLGAYSDLTGSDWGCKYAEAALANGFIAQNATFRPDDLVTQIEALKMIMQGRNIPRDQNDDWKVGYKTKAEREGIIDDEYLDFDTNAIRGWIFSNSARSYGDFRFTQEVEIAPEVEELFDSIFNL